MSNHLHDPDDDWPGYDREKGDPHPLLDFGPFGDEPCFIGDIDSLLDEVTRERRVMWHEHDDDQGVWFAVELYETDWSGVAEWGTGQTLDEALRNALGAYLD